MAKGLKKALEAHDKIVASQKKKGTVASRPKQSVVPAEKVQPKSVMEVKQEKTDKDLEPFRAEWSKSFAPVVGYHKIEVAKQKKGKFICNCYRGGQLVHTKHCKSITRAAAFKSIHLEG